MKDIKEKARFFAQYWGQAVLMDNHKRTSLGNCHEILAESLIQVFDTDYLLLKNLANITDEEAVEVLKLSSYNERWIKLLKDKSFYGGISIGEWVLKNELDSELLSGVVDYLRGRKYLVPFNGKSPEEIIKKGWAKYEE